MVIMAVVVMAIKTAAVQTSIMTLLVLVVAMVVFVILPMAMVVIVIMEARRMSSVLVRALVMVVMVIRESVPRRRMGLKSVAVPGLLGRRSLMPAAVALAGGAPVDMVTAFFAIVIQIARSRFFMVLMSAVLHASIMELS